MANTNNTILFQLFFCSNVLGPALLLLLLLLAVLFLGLFLARGLVLVLVVLALALRTRLLLRVLRRLIGVGLGLGLGGGREAEEEGETEEFDGAKDSTKSSGKYSSATIMRNPPPKKPAAATIQFACGFSGHSSSASAIAGAKREKKEAASMTPTEAPKEASKTNCIVFLGNCKYSNGKINAAPAAVEAQPSRLPRKAIIKGEYVSIILFSCRVDGQWRNFQMMERLLGGKSLFSENLQEIR